MKKGCDIRGLIDTGGFILDKSSLFSSCGINYLKKEESEGKGDDGRDVVEK